MNVVDWDGDLKKNGITSNLISLNDIDWEKPMDNPTTYKPYADKLKNNCSKFIL